MTRLPYGKRLAALGLALALALCLAPPGLAASEEMSILDNESTVPIGLKPDTISLYTGETVDLSVLLRVGEEVGVRWTTDWLTIGKVDSNGVVTAKKAGTCTITARYSDAAGAQRSQSFSLRVKSPEEGEWVELDQYVMTYQDSEGGTMEVPRKSAFARQTSHASSSAIRMYAGESLDLTRLFHPGSRTSSEYGTVRWTLGEAEGLSMTGGVLTAQQAGTYQIRCSHVDPIEHVYTQEITLVVH